MTNEKEVWQRADEFQARDLAEALDSFVINYGLATVLRKLSEVCGEAAHIIRDNVHAPDDLATARKYETTGRRLDRLADGLSERLQRGNRQ